MKTEPDAITDNLATLAKQRRVNVLPGVTARSLAAMLDQFDRGYLRQAALAWREMIERDETLITAVPKARRRVSRRPWEVLIGEEVPEDLQEAAKKHQAALKRFYSTLRVTNATERDEQGSVSTLIRRMMDAPFFRYAVCRLIWQPTPDGLQCEARYVPAEYFEATTGRLQWAGVDGITPGQPMPDRENWLVAVSDTCLMKALSICYIFKRLPLQDALNFCQRFGIPTVHGETNAKPGSDEWNTFVTGLNAFANDQTIATTIGDKINVLSNAAANGEQVFGWIIDSMKRAMVTICTGSDLATMSRADGAGASLQGDEADELTADFCQFITETFQQLDRTVIAWEFGEGVEPLAFFKLIPPQKQDAALEMKIDDHVTKHGVMLTPEDVAERFSRTHEAESEGQRAESANPADAANEAQRTITQIRAAGRQAFRSAVRGDLAPLVKALRPLVEAQGANESRAAALSLNLNAASIEDAVLDGNASTAALEVALATELLRGLASNPSAN